MGSKGTEKSCYEVKLNCRWGEKLDDFVSVQKIAKWKCYFLKSELFSAKKLRDINK